MAKVLVGLGNPGPEYQENRHNIGFLFLDALAHHWDFPTYSLKKDCFYTEGTLGGEKIILLKPLRFMNLSGIPVSDYLRFFKIPLDHVYVAHDDLDLALGKLKVKQGGGHGGHNGLKSLDQYIGSGYWRLRFGIDHPGHRDLVNRHVLGNFKKEERSVVDDLFHKVVRAFPKLLSNQEALFLNEISRPGS